MKNLCAPCSTNDHGNCDGTAWHDERDEVVVCDCYDAEHEEPKPGRIPAASTPSSPESTHTPSEVVRPNGKVYRARRVPFIDFCMWNDGSAVLCRFTHDVERVTDDAREMWTAEVGTNLPDPKLIWIKEVPWDAFGMGYDRTIMSVGGDTKGSTPAVLFADDEQPDVRNPPAGGAS